jgi:hypothetical protein
VLSGSTLFAKWGQTLCIRPVHLRVLKIEINLFVCGPPKKKSLFGGSITTNIRSKLGIQNQ